MHGSAISQAREKEWAGVDPAGTAAVTRRVVQAALVNGAHLLDESERDLLLAFLELPVQAASLQARLFRRVNDVFRPDLLPRRDRGWLDLLEERGFLDAQVEWPRHLEIMRVPELRAACKGLGLPHKGRRVELVGRLSQQLLQPEVPAMRTLHRDLVRMADLLCFQDPHRDHRVMVLDIMGVRKAPRYDITPAPPAFAHRREMLAFLEALQRLEQEPALEHLGWARRRWLEYPAPSVLRRRLSPRNVAGRLMYRAARELERKGQHRQAADIYLELLGGASPGEGGAGVPEGLVRRAALALSRAGRTREALSLMGERRQGLHLAERLALDRTARRLAAGLGSTWEHCPLLLQAGERRLRLTAAASSGPRPLYTGSRGALPVEQAVVELLEAGGRRVLYGEGAPWTTLFALLFYDLLWMPVPGALPVSNLAAPLDMGTHAFWENRRQPILERLREIRGGAGPRLVERRYSRHLGEQIQGARWNLATGQELALLARALGGRALASIMEYMARAGRQARSGMPDLVVLPGAGVEIPGVVPGGLSRELLLVEVKGPGDTLRDRQAAWIHRLLQVGVKVEIWRVEARDSP